MGCCPGKPEVLVGDSADGNVSLQDSAIRPGESVECYMRRTENPSGLKDDLTGFVPNKIATTSIVVGAGVSVDVTFKLTPDSTATVSTWSASWSPSTPAGLTLNSSTGRLSGTVGAADRNKLFAVTITAYDDTPAEIDSRQFVFSTVEPMKSNSIQFVHPLPGAIVTSKFGPRVHPVRGTQAPHKGVDFALPGNKIGDVVAAADGYVVFTGFEAGGAGNYAKINHRDAAGKVICQTVYMHLEKFYVSVGDRVAAGQKIGREGNTGIGTGPHLHFECRLLAGGEVSWTDPLPLIRGTVQVADKTNPDNTAAGAITSQTNNGQLTGADAAAKSGSCAPFGPSYPADPTETNTNPPAALPDDPFELAWYFTMTKEVGPNWTADPQTDTEIVQGLKETASQRKKVGYVNTAGYPGGETKFGIAQGPNPSINVGAADYATAKKVGYNNYWLKGPSSYASSKPKTSIMLFDMFYLHGKSNVTSSILSTANIGSLTDDQSVDALYDAQVAFINKIVQANPSRERYKNGWLKRASLLRSFVQSL